MEKGIETLLMQREVKTERQCFKNKTLPVTSSSELEVSV